MWLIFLCVDVKVDCWLLFLNIVINVFIKDDFFVLIFLIIMRLMVWYGLGGEYLYILFKSWFFDLNVIKILS